MLLAGAVGGHPARQQRVVRLAVDGPDPAGDRWRVRSLYRAAQASLPKETIGVGAGFDFQLFDRALLYSPDTRFVLAGIVNRMDRTYVAEASCGEIRLIYRLTRINKAAGDDAAPPRLPMTLNLVLKAKGEGVGRSPAPKSPIAGSLLRLGGALHGKGRPARPDRLREHRPHRDQSPDRARAEIRGSRFPHRLSAEGVSLRRGKRASSRKRRWKTRSTARGCWRTMASSASSGHGCSIPSISPRSIAAPR